MLHGTTFKDEALRAFDSASKTRNANNGCLTIFSFSLSKCARTKYENIHCQQYCKLSRVIDNSYGENRL